MCYDKRILEPLGSRSRGSQLILDLFGCNQCKPCPQAISFFESLCPAPFPPVSPLFSMKSETLLVADGKASAYNLGDPGSNPGSGRSPGDGNGSPLQYSCLENPMDGG